MSKVIIGIDPGSKESAIAVLDENAQYIEHHRLSNWTPHEFKQALLSIKQNGKEIMLAAVEKVGVMPGQGISSSGKFMKATGIIIGLLTGLDIPFVEVAPQTWRKISPTLATTKGESSTEKKKKSLEYAQNRFPGAKLTKQIEHNVADALAITEWLYLNRGKK